MARAPVKRTLASLTALLIASVVAAPALAAVATSDDLISWKRRETIDEDASQPTITVLPGGSLLVAYEKTTLVDLLPRRPLKLEQLLHNPLKILDDPFNRIRLRFRYYRSADDLLDGRVAREFTAGRQLSPPAEGTPSITNATLRGGLISRSRIEVGFGGVRAEFAGGSVPPEQLRELAHVPRRSARPCADPTADRDQWRQPLVRQPERHRADGAERAPGPVHVGLRLLRGAPRRARRDRSSTTASGSASPAGERARRARMLGGMQATPSAATGIQRS